MSNDNPLSHDELAYFHSVLPWQNNAWNQLVTRYGRLPHGLLFSGMQGTGKRAFVWRFVAWLLCDNREANPQGACGECQSCQWLASGTHPDLMVLPASSMPVSTEADVTPTKNNKSKKSKSTKSATKDTEVPKTSIKVDDIRELQPFINQGSSGRRVCVIDNADTMTVAAANALLKTLEEPRDGIHLLLITDMPTKLLPTIKSRVQQVGIDHMQAAAMNDYLMDEIKSKQLIAYTDEDTLLNQIKQSVRLANGAPLAALDILRSDWYQYRSTWVKVWLALRAGKRLSVAASDYWQKTLSLNDLLKLSEMMLMDFSRLVLGMTSLQQDIDLEGYPSIQQLNMDAIQTVLNTINDIKQSIQQNVQDKMAYDKLMAALVLL